MNKEVYVYREDTDTFGTLSSKLDVAAKQVGVILSSKKRRLLLRELSKEGKVSIFRAEPKVHKELNATTIQVSVGVQSRLNSKKVEKRFSSYDEVISDCISKLDAIEKMVDNCAGDDTNCAVLFNNLYELLNGEKR